MLTNVFIRMPYLNLITTICPIENLHILTIPTSIYTLNLAYKKLTKKNKIWLVKYRYSMKDTYRGVDQM
jgi:hypothetical protein